MGFDDELPDRMRGGVDGLQPDVSRLVSGGMARGKRMVRRRRIVQVVAAGATVAVLSGVAYAAPWQGAGGNGGLQVAAPPSATRSPTLSASPRTSPKATTPATPESKKGQVDITPQAALQLLLDQLPEDAKTRKYSGSGGWSTMPPGIIIHDKLQYVQGGAVTHMAVGFSTGQENQDGCGDVGPDESCDSERLSDGSVFTLSKYSLPDSGGVVNWFATLTRPDGVSILIIEGNAAEKEGVPPSRPTPPLSAGQLKAILTSPTWQAKLDPAYVARAEHLFKPEKQ
jgi:hypothetical protein